MSSKTLFFSNNDGESTILVKQQLRLFKKIFEVTLVDSLKNFWFTFLPCEHFVPSQFTNFFFVYQGKIFS